jgi:hypothetical protein
MPQLDSDNSVSTGRGGHPHHLDVESWQSDMRSERSVVIDGAQVLRATSIEVRVESSQVAADLIAIGIPRVVRIHLRYRSTGF